MTTPTTEESIEKEAHLLGDSLLNSLAIDNVFVEEISCSPCPTWQQSLNPLPQSTGSGQCWSSNGAVASQTHSHLISNNLDPPHSVEHQELTTDQRPSGVGNLGQWNIWTVPFSPVKVGTTPSSPSLWSTPPSATAVVHRKFSSAEHQKPIAVVAPESQRKVVASPQLPPKIASYRDVASKSTIHSAKMSHGATVAEQSPLCLSKTFKTSASEKRQAGKLLAKENFRPQSSSDSSSESSVNLTSTRFANNDGDRLKTKDSDNESEQSSVQSGIVDPLDVHVVSSHSNPNLINTNKSVNATLTDKLTNLYRKNKISADENESSNTNNDNFDIKLSSFVDEHQNAFKKNATTVTDRNAIFNSCKKTRELNPSAYSDCLISNENGSVAAESNKISQKMLRKGAKKEYSINTDSCEPKLNNIEAAKNIPRSMSQKDYIKNDLKTFGLIENLRRLAQENGPESDEDLEEISLRLEKEKKRRSDRNDNQSFGLRVQQKGSGKKKNWENSDRSDRHRHKKRQSNSLVLSINAILATFVLYLQSIVLWLFNLVIDIAHQLFDILVHCIKLCYAKISSLSARIHSEFTVYLRKLWLFVRQKEWTFAFWWRNRKKHEIIGIGLEDNIALPSTGAEAITRLLTCRGQDAYSVLGVRPDCSDEELKHYYRKQAVLVHPDKNSSYGAEEAFKILAAAFEMVGIPEQRHQYDMENLHRTKAMKELEEMLNKLRAKMEEVRSTMQCDCGFRHKRLNTNRELSSARYCRRCRIHHAAQNGDIWAESRWIGILWYYFACMDGVIYDVTEWASCQRNKLKHIRANDHFVRYRLSVGANNNRSNKSNKHRSNDKAFDDKGADDFVNRLLTEKLNFGAGNGIPPANCSNQADFAFPETSAADGITGDFSPMHSKFRPATCNTGDVGRPRKGGRRRKGNRIF